MADLLDLPAVAAVLRVHPRTLRRWMAESDAAGIAAPWVRVGRHRALPSAIDVNVLVRSARAPGPIAASR